MDSESVGGKDRLKALHDRHHEIARLMALGYGNAEIASQLGLKPSTVSALRSGSPLLRSKVQELSEGRDNMVGRIREEVKGLMPLAVTALERIVENADGQITDASQLKAASMVLGICGIAPVQHTKHMVFTAALPQEKLASLVDTLQRNRERAITECGVPNASIQRIECEVS